MPKKLTLDNTKLWDEILKAIVDAMPEQLFPLFQEVYGKEYPKGTPITLLATESSTYRENPDAPPNSRLSDIALLVNGTDYYHLECQMRNEGEMIIRMIAYDLHFAMQHTISNDKKNKEIIVRFPRSVVIYPSKNKQLPKSLQCRIIFQDGSEHIYQIPTVRIQTYSLQEIHKKHLNLFLPYVLLRLRPKLEPKTRHPLTKKELTAFVHEVILILEDELRNGYLTDQEFNDYINLFCFAADKIFENKKYSRYREEVHRMTKPLIELPSVRDRRLKEEMRDVVKAEVKDEIRAEVRAEVKNEVRAEVKDEVKAEIKDEVKAEVKDEVRAEIKDEVKAEMELELAEKDAQIAEKDVQIAQMRELLRKYNIVTA